MLLQSHTSVDTVAEFDPETGHLDIYSRKAEPARAAGAVCGAFAEIGKKRHVIYRDGDALYLDVCGRRFALGTLDVDIEQNGCRRLLRVSSCGRRIVELWYDAPPPGSGDRLDPTAFAEEEDFDFAIFLRNVSLDRARQARIYRVE